MARYLSLLALLSVVLVATQDASAKAPHRGMHGGQPRVAQFAQGNAAAMGVFGYGWSPFYGAPAYGPVIGYMPVYGIGSSGFVGSYGAGGLSTTFVTPVSAGKAALAAPPMAIGAPSASSTPPGGFSQRIFSWR